ncbi:hypothetical protein [Streptomyces sp. MK5]|uniref:hypothetical protein n=1 Tax=Streptomyces sp. MK5 TaxID=3064253 RepID=UPI0027423E87|nr:hypothetical protein [Streptomyces sp. MK5]
MTETARPAGSSTVTRVVPVGDLGPRQEGAAWPDTSRFRAVSGLVRAAMEAAEDSHAQTAAST